MNYYLVDGSEDCFFTAVFFAYNDAEGVITSERDLQLGFDSGIREMSADGEKCDRVKAKLNACDSLAVEEICLLLRSCDRRKEQIALEYIRLILSRRRPVRQMTNLAAVMDMVTVRYKITGELHRFTGFLRFMENDAGFLYAPYTPDNDITDLLAEHFAERLKNQKFIIHDVNRNIAAVYDGQSLVMIQADEAQICLSQEEKAFEKLWKLYYDSVNIKERPHEKQMKAYMPVRYWKFLPEKH